MPAPEPKRRVAAKASSSSPNWLPNARLDDEHELLDYAGARIRRLRTCALLRDRVKVNMSCRKFTTRSLPNEVLWRSNAWSREPEGRNEYADLRRVVQVIGWRGQMTKESYVDVRESRHARSPTTHAGCTEPTNRPAGLISLFDPSVSTP